MGKYNKTKTYRITVTRKEVHMWTTDLPLGVLEPLAVKLAEYDQEFGSYSLDEIVNTTDYVHPLEVVIEEVPSEKKESSKAVKPSTKKK